MNFKERMLAALQGEMPDTVPFAPRIDLWHTARKARGTLPREHRDRSADEICRAEGWALYKLTSNYTEIADDPWHTVLTSLGIFISPDVAYAVTFSNEIEVAYSQTGVAVTVEFKTPRGNVSAVLEYTDQMRLGGVTYPWVKERLVKTFEDWKIVAAIFDHMLLVPRYAAYEDLLHHVGPDCVVASAASDPSSPMHHVQKYFFEGTDFFLLYKDRHEELSRFAASIANYYNQVIDILAASPVEMVTWGGNYDATITYPPYFEKEILPWLSKAARILGSKGIITITHCDGENKGLMEMIKHSGVDAAESLCPYPMTRLKLHEYYARWADKITLIGGIPSEYLIPQMTAHEEFEGYLNYLLKAVAPGLRFIGGITDAVPPDADFDRLRRVHDFFETRGHTPLASGPVVDFFGNQPAEEKKVTAPAPAWEEKYGLVREAIFTGNREAMGPPVAELLEKGVPAEQILQEGMIAAMTLVGDRFSVGELFIPEMLKAAQVMQSGVELLKPHLLSGSGPGLTRGVVLLGTVFGDLHDIGKNLVAIMLRAVGFEVVDLGTNVTADTFLGQVRERKPDILALSALLTTTMPEMKKVIDTLAEAGLRDSVRVLVGGAPITAKYAREIGADEYAENAGEAAARAQDLLSKPAAFD
jgi:corrinoid protein of di/trimethylamine methyltransferase